MGIAGRFTVLVLLAVGGVGVRAQDVGLAARGPS
jgi:hypothetical protein